MNKAQILLVDDDDNSLLALSHILRPKYTIYIATDGQTAIRITKKNHPDLILLDIAMPNMTGLEVLSYLKSTNSLRDIPVIIVTGRDAVEDEDMGYSLGAVDYIKKPLFNTSVIAKIEMHLRNVKYIKAVQKLTDA